MSVFKETLENILNEEGYNEHPFYTFEPFDVEERAQWIYDLAKKDDLDMQSVDFIRCYGEAPHKFQTGIIADDIKVKVGLANTQSGKTMATMIASIISITGEIPFCFRYDKGEKTPYKRLISKENILRYGRIDMDGNVIDRNWKSVEDGTWDCGNIVGVGKYNKDLISSRYNDKVWIGCHKEHKDQTWFPGYRKLIPEHCLNKTIGVNNDGFRDREGEIHLRDGKQINVITYEQGHKKFESRKVWMIVLDEEPPDEKIYDSAVRHCEYLLMSYTAYNGISWSKSRLLLSAIGSKSIQIYQCCAFDTPYLQKEEVLTENKGSPIADRHSRMWGIFSEAVGKEFYDREFLVACKRNIPLPLMYGTIYPVGEYSGNPKELIEKQCILERQMDYVEDRSNFDTRNVWEIYEDVIYGYGYFVTCDLAKGCDDPYDRKDRSVAYVFKSFENGKFLKQPKMVAALRSYAEQYQFSSLVLYACAYYNNATLFPENRGEDAGAFNSYTRDWPFYGEMTVINEKTDRPSKRLGFVTSGKNRRFILDSTKELFADATPENHPFIHPPLIDEMMAFGWRNGRPDHPKHGTSDCIMALAISRWLWTYNKEQLVCNKNNKPKILTREVSRGSQKKTLYGVALGYG